MSGEKFAIKRFSIFVLFLFGLFISINNVSAATVNYYVDPTGTDDGSHGLSTGTDAWATIQYAVTNVANPTTDVIIINISGNTFTTNNDDINIDRGFTDLTLQGASAGTTIVQSHTDPDSSTARVFYVGGGEYVTFADMTIRYGYTTSNGAALYFSSSGSLTVEDCIIYDNDAPDSGDSGGFYIDSNAVITNTTFYNNNADYVGAIYASRSGLAIEITNCTFYGNTGSSAGAVYFSSIDLTMTNTIMTQGSELLLQGSVDAYFKNCILVDNTTYYDLEYYNFYGTVYGEYNIIGNEESDSFFTDGIDNNSVVDSSTLSDLGIKDGLSKNNATNNVLTLGVSSGSGAVDAGDSVAHNGVTPPATDQRGEARYNVTYDIGPYEYQGSDDVDPLIDSISSVDENNTYVTLTFDEGVYNTDGGSGALEASDLSVTNFTANGGSASDVSITSVAQTDDNPLAGGETEIKVNISVTGTSNGVETFTLSPANVTSIYDAAGNAMYTNQVSDAVTLNGHFDYYVDPTGTDDGSHGTGTGTDAWATIQYAITNVPNPTTAPMIINISGDTYTTNNDDISIARNFTDLTLQGAGIDQTIIQPHADPDSASDENFIISSGNNVTFADMTIRYGRTTGTGAAIQASLGDLTIEDCLIYDNDGPGSDDSGGVYGRGNTVISNSTFMENDGDYVSAFYHSESGKTVEITNSTFIENNDSSVGQIYILGANSTFTNSLVAKGGGGVFLQSGNHYFKNSIIADSDSGYDLDYYYSPTIHNNGYNIIGVQDSGSYFQQGVDGCIVISNDSLSTINFKPAASQNNSTNGSLTLAATSGSSAIDAGSSVANNGVTIPTTDQRGQSRVSTVDIGPYEVQASDTDDPLISSISEVDESNTYITLIFDEGVYNTDGGSGALEASDLSVTNFTANGGSASDVSITSVAQTDDNPLAGGETEIKVNISVTGTSNGVETFTVSPADNTSIYDADGNPMSTYQVSDTVTLNGHFDYYVDPTGTDDVSHGTGTGTDAWATIQYAVTNVANPTTAPIVINIAAGTYITNNDDIDIDRNFTDLTLQGADASTTIIKPHADPTLATAGNIDIGSTENVTMNDLTIRDGQFSTTYSGPGIDFSSGNLVINDCIIDDNDNSYDGTGGYAGIYANGDITINNSTISNNDGDYLGGLALNGDVNIITNSTFYNNTGGYAGNIGVSDGDTWITNCTITKGGDGISSFSSGYDHVYIKNSLIYGDDSGISLDFDGATSKVFGYYNILEGQDDSYCNDNCVVGGSPTLNMKAGLSKNNATNNTLSVGISTSGGATIDTGSATANNGVDIPTADQRGQARVSTVDIGSFEVQAGDTADPLAITFSPVDNATGVVTTSNFVITFDENVDVETGNVLIYKSDDTLVETIDITSGKVTGTGTTEITINPDANLTQETDHYIQIASTTFDDGSSNSYMGISDEVSWTFTTADETNPGLSTLSPANDATNININSNLVITFNEIVDAETGNIYLYKEVGDELIQTFNVTSDISGTGTDTITINPTADLLEDTEYYVQIDATAFDDSSSNSYDGITDETSWDFTTGDFTNPTVSTLSPSNDSTGAVVDNNLVITFDEAVAADSGNIYLYKYDDTLIQTFDVTTDISGSGTDTITVNPTSNLQELTEYYVQIDATAFNDDSVNANSYAGISDETSWDFTTTGTAGITPSVISGNTTEAGGIATFTVVLDTEPIANVTIPVSSSDSGEGTVDQESLIFTSANWATPQTVTVTGIDDDLQDGNQVYTAILGAATSSDGNYNSLNPSDVAITNTDNDTAGVNLSETTQTVAEAGATDSYTIVLNSQPTNDVIISLNDSNDQITVTSSLTFTSANWATPQTVTVSAINDDIDDIIDDIISHAVTSGDANYNGISVNNVTVTVTDNDTFGFTISNLSGQTTETGNTATFTIRLNSQPTANVIVPVSSSDSTEGTVSSASLTFTSANWSSNQTITVTGVDDDIDDDDITYSIIIGSITSADSNYNSQNPNDLVAVNTDDDTYGITVSLAEITIDEGDNGQTFTLILDSEPTAEVLISIDSVIGEVSISDQDVVFTADNWDVLQTVTVQAIDDDDVEQLQDETIYYTVSSVDTNYNNYPIDNLTVSIIDNDEEEDNNDQNNNGIPDIYEDINPTNKIDVADSVTDIEADNNGNIIVTYKNGIQSTLNIFDTTTAKKVKIKQIKQTGYVAVTQALGKQVVVVNVLNGEIIATKTLSKKSWNSLVAVKTFTLQKKTWITIIAKNKKNSLLLSAVQLKSDYTLGKKISVNLTSKSIIPAKTKTKKNNILLKNKKKKTLVTFLLTKKYKFVLK